MQIEKLQDVYTELQKEDVNLSDKYVFTHKKKTKNKLLKMSLGRIWWNLLLPENFQLIDEPVTDKKLNEIIVDLINKYSPEKITETLNLINKNVFYLGTIVPVSFNFDSFIVPDKILRKKEKILNENLSPEEFTQHLTLLGEELLEYLEKTNNPLYDIIKSGARSNSLELATLLIAKGSGVDIEGNIFKPTLNSVETGFNLNEFYQNASEARSSLFEVSVGSAEPGTLASSIAYANSSLQLTSKDCKTKKYLDLFVTESMISKLLGRFYLDEKSNSLKEITAKLNIKNKKIKLRSPLFCKQKDGLCNVCVGKISEKIDTKFIGFISYAVLNKKGLSAALASKHAIRSSRFLDVDFRRDLIKA